MKTKPLGRTGVQVSELCFGTMSFGGDADEATSTAMYKATRDAGINFYDCADQYNKGKSEEILGKLIKGHRENLVITTKCYNPMSEDVNARADTLLAPSRRASSACRPIASRCCSCTSSTSARRSTSRCAHWKISFARARCSTRR